MSNDPAKEPGTRTPWKRSPASKVGHGKAPFALVIMYLIILVWAVLAWIRPEGNPKMTPRIPAPVPALLPPSWRRPRRDQGLLRTGRPASGQLVQSAPPPPRRALRSPAPRPLPIGPAFRPSRPAGLHGQLRRLPRHLLTAAEQADLQKQAHCPGPPGPRRQGQGAPGRDRWPAQPAKNGP